MRKIIYKTKELAIVNELPNRYAYWQHWTREEKSDMVLVVDGKHRTARAFRKVKMVKNENSLLARMIGETRTQYFDLYVPVHVTTE